MKTKKTSLREAINWEWLAHHHLEDDGKVNTDSEESVTVPPSVEGEVWMDTQVVNGQWVEVPALIQPEDIAAAQDRPVETAVRLLREAGVDIRLPWSPGLGVLVAEAVNWAAKEIDWNFYRLKPLVIDEVARWHGVQSGWDEEGTFFLSASEAGTCTFHDPDNQITARGHWPHAWSGVRRQEFAFDCLADAPIRRQLALITAPRMAAHLGRHLPHLQGPVGTLP